MTEPVQSAEVLLRDLCQFITDGDHQAPPRAESGVPFITISAIKKGSVDLNSAVRFVPPAYVASLDASRKPKAGDVLYSVTGSIGLSALVDDQVNFVFQRHIAILRPDQSICDPRWLNYILASPQIREQAQTVATGTAQLTISLAGLRTFKVPFSSLTRQRDVVSKLDALTTRIAQARAELARVPLLVRHLKQQALSICFSASLECPSVLMGNILKGVQAGKNLRCEERPPHLGELGVVKVNAVTWGRFDPTKAKTLPPDYIPPETARIRAGDLLMSRANTIELVGAVVLVEQAPRDLFLSDKILRLVVPDDAKRWIQWFLRSPSGRKQIEQMATGNQLSMRNLSQDALRRIELPFPNAAKRLAAVQCLEAAFSRADSLQNEAARASELLDRLEKSILARAFRGELVPQDSAAETAAALLDRVRAERAAVPKAKRGRRAAPAANS